MKIQTQNAQQIQNIEGDVGSFTVNTTFSGNIEMNKQEILKEIESIETEVPEVKKEAEELKEEMEKEKPDTSTILEKFEKLGTLVKKVSASKEVLQKIISLGSRIGGFLGMIL